MFHTPIQYPFTSDKIDAVKQATLTMCLQTWSSTAVRFTRSIAARMPVKSSSTNIV